MAKQSDYVHIDMFQGSWQLHLPVERRNAGEVHIDVTNTVKLCADSVHDRIVAPCELLLAAFFTELSFSGILGKLKEVRHLAAFAARGLVNAFVDLRVGFITVDDASLGCVDHQVVIVT